MEAVLCKVQSYLHIRKLLISTLPSSYICCQVLKVLILCQEILFAFKLTKNADPDKNKYSGYCIAFDACGSVLLSDGGRLGKNVIIFDADMNSLMYIDSRKDILILGKDQTDGLDYTKFTVEKEYSINFTEQLKKFCLGHDKMILCLAVVHVSLLNILHQAFFW